MDVHAHIRETEQKRSPLWHLSSAWNSMEYIYICILYSDMIFKSLKSEPQSHNDQYCILWYLKPWWNKALKTCSLEMSLNRSCKELESMNWSLIWILDVLAISVIHGHWDQTWCAYQRANDTLASMVDPMIGMPVPHPGGSWEPGLKPGPTSQKCLEVAMWLMNVSHCYTTCKARSKPVNVKEWGKKHWNTRKLHYCYRTSNLDSEEHGVCACLCWGGQGGPKNHDASFAIPKELQHLKKSWNPASQNSTDRLGKMQLFEISTDLFDLKKLQDDNGQVCLKYSYYCRTFFCLVLFFDVFETYWRLRLNESPHQRTNTWILEQIAAIRAMKAWAPTWARLWRPERQYLPDRVSKQTKRVRTIERRAGFKNHDWIDLAWFVVIVVWLQTLDTEVAQVYTIMNHYHITIIAYYCIFQFM